MGDFLFGLTFGFIVGGIVGALAMAGIWKGRGNPG
jgi:hypothetical protein